jgi:hypothetical protein
VTTLTVWFFFIKKTNHPHLVEHAAKHAEIRRRICRETISRTRAARHGAMSIVKVVDGVNVNAVPAGKFEFDNQKKKDRSELQQTQQPMP